VASIQREEYVEVAKADDQLQPGDTAVMLVRKNSQQAILDLFEKTD